MKSRNKHAILIPDGNRDHITGSVVRCLSKVHGIDIHVLSHDPRSALRFSRHVKQLVYWPEAANESEWIANVVDVIIRESIDVVMPIEYHGVRTVSRFRKRIPNSARVVPLPAVDSLDIASNKWLMSQHLRQHNIPHIPGQLCRQAEKYRVEINTLRFPVLLKPVTKTGGGVGIRRFENNGDLVEYLDTQDHGDDYLIQPFVRGHDLGINMLCKDGDILACAMQRETLPGVRPFTPYVGMEFFYDQALYTVVERLMKSLDWSGVANLDFRWDESGGQYRMVELNPRYWVTLEASCLMGVNFPGLAYSAAVGDTFPPPDYRKDKYLSLAGMGMVLKSPRLMRTHPIHRHRTPLRMNLADPVVFCYRLFAGLRRLIPG
jgi:predicted ATP-grasp superfamily ATP-dependent carboligase